MRTGFRIRHIIYFILNNHHKYHNTHILLQSLKHCIFRNFLYIHLVLIRFAYYNCGFVIFIILNFSCEGRIRTSDLWVMSPTSYHCSTSLYVRERVKLECQRCTYTSALRGYKRLLLFSLFISPFQTYNYLLAERTLCHAPSELLLSIVLPDFSLFSGRGRSRTSVLKHS